MVGVANKAEGYDAEDERLLSTFANQLAIAIDNGRLYEHQRAMIARLQQLNRRLSEAEREQLLALERERIAAGLHDRIEQDMFMRRRLAELKRTSGIDTDLVVSGTPMPAVAKVEDTLLAVIRESLTNVMKHSQARMVLVSIRYESDRIEVVVQDDSVGIPELVLSSSEDSYMHYGLRNMHQQIAGLGGSFDVTSGEESGLTIRMRVPLPGRAE
jgi:signal transduction histidine kinase